MNPDYKLFESTAFLVSLLISGVLLWLVGAIVGLRYIVGMTLQYIGPLAAIASLAAVVVGLVILALGLFRVWRKIAEKSGT